MKDTKNQKTSENRLPKESNLERRGFLKKAVYVAPTLISLGTLLRSTDAKAGFGGPPSAPDWNQAPPFQ